MSVADTETSTSSTSEGGTRQGQARTLQEEAAAVPAASPRRRALTPGGLVDGVAIVVMLGVVMVGFLPVWGDWTFLRPAVVGLVVGLAVAWVGARFRWPAFVVLPAGVLGAVVFSGIAVPDAAIAGFLPSAGTLSTLVVESVGGWKDFVTTVPPLYPFPELAVVPYVLFLASGLVAGTIAWRSRQAQWAVLVPATGLILVIALGTSNAAFPVVQGIVLVAAGLLWAGWRTTAARLQSIPSTNSSSGEARRRLGWYRARTSAAILVVSAVVGVVAAPVLLPSSPRSVLRDEIVPPLNLHDYVSPLTAFRKYTAEMTDDDLFTVTGLTEDFRIRLAALDLYDGTVYTASSENGGVFHRAGSEIISTASGEDVQLDVEISGYVGVWIPDLGTLTGIEWSGPRSADLSASTYYNAGTGTGLATVGLDQGDSYRLRARLSDVPSPDDLRHATVSDLPIPPIADAIMPTNVLPQTKRLVGTMESLTDRLFALRDGLEASGVYSSGLDLQPPSRPGHSAGRIDTLLGGEKMVGDDEQFAVALALMANQVGIPARVVIGFYPDDGVWTPGTPYTARGGDVRAWVEVPFEEYGWVPITVRPDEDNQVAPQDVDDPQPKPPVINEPEPPEEPAKEKPSAIGEEQTDPDEDGGINWATILVVAVYVLVPLLVLGGPIIAVLLYKARRRLRRRRGRPVDGFTGGWREVVDVATDLGTVVPSGTRREEVAAIEEAFGETRAAVVARRADATVFGAADPSVGDVESFWTEVGAVISALCASVPRRVRLKSSVSLRSVLRRSPSTIENRQRRTGSSASKKGPHE